MNMETTYDEHLNPADFRRFVELNVALERLTTSESRRAALRSIIDGTQNLLTKPTAELMQALPPLIGEAMKPFGWLWNGYYSIRGNDRSAIHSGHAYGPPVCSSLERSGGPLSSGMCFDALSLNQTMAAYETKQWPGYVSCDATSGLATISGIVCPVRNPLGHAIAVWDLDATKTVDPADVRTMDVLFATLSRCKDITGDDL